MSVGTILSSPVIADDTIYVGSTDGEPLRPDVEKVKALSGPIGPPKGFAVQEVLGFDRDLFFAVNSRRCSARS